MILKVKKIKKTYPVLPNSREMVKWLSDAKENQISEVFQFENSFVVAYVKDHHKKRISKLQMWKIQ